MTGRADPISEELAERFLVTLRESGNTRDPDLMVSLYAPDVAVDDHGASDTLVGREALRELFGGIFRVISDIAFERIGPALYSPDRTTLYARWRISGTRPNGQPFGVETVGFYRPRCSSRL